MKQTIVVQVSRRFRSCFIIVAIGVCFSLALPCALGAADPAQCSANPDSRQLDFWLGDWAVTYPGVSIPSRSKVYLELDKCLLVESWEGGKDHSGKNMFAYSSDDKGWHGMFADNQGRVHVFEGKVAPGAAEFLGPSIGSDGQAFLNRIKVVRVSPNKVQQTWEKSSDKGATWTMEFRGEYSRANP
jgi:hypothetical protein